MSLHCCLSFPCPVCHSVAAEVIRSGAVPRFPLGQVCEHGSLRRKCEVCDLNEEVRELRTALHAMTVSAGDAYAALLDDIGQPLATPESVIAAMEPLCDVILRGSKGLAS